MTTEPNAPDKTTIRQRLYELMEDDTVPLDDKQRRALALGRTYLGVTDGHIQRRNEDDTDEVVASVGEEAELLPEGTVLDRARTYCRRTVETQSPVALSNVPEQGWAEDPAYEEHGFDCYLGTTIFVGGDVYGTVCFIAETPRQTDFTADEKGFVELLARLLGRAIEAEAYEQRLEGLSRSRNRSEAKYEALLQVAPDAIFVVDADSGTIETVNDRATNLTGYSEADLCGMSILELHPAADRDRHAQLLDSGLDEGVQERFDDGTPLTIMRSDGTEIPIELGLSRVELEDHTAILGIIRDVSDRRERGRELARQRELFRQIQEAVGLGGWEINLETGEGRWTDEVYRIFDLPIDSELTASEALDYFHPEDRPRITDAFERLTEAGEPYDLELRIRTVEGAVRWVRTVGRPRYADGDKEAGQPSSVLGIIRDITERKERQQDLRIKDQAIEESSVGITIGDADRSDTPIVYANTGFEELTGYSKAYAMDKNCRFLQGEATDEETIAEIRRAIEAEESIQTEVLNYRANGTPFWNELTISPVMGAESRAVTHYVGVQKDVTEQKRRERLIDVLDRVLRHNLRNDMNVVIGFAETIAARNDGETARMAIQLKETALELIDLSNKVRRFETGVTDSKPLEARDMRAEIRTVVKVLQEDHPDTEFQVTAESAMTVLATDQLTAALSELGDNAAKYGDSTVCYELTTTEDGRIAVHVSDSGLGLPTTERNVLESGQETPLEHGSGLGLWMVNWIVTSLGGTVTASIDDGTTVSVYLPAAADSDTDRPRTSAVSDRSEEK